MFDTSHSSTLCSPGSRPSTSSVMAGMSPCPPWSGHAKTRGLAGLPSGGKNPVAVCALWWRWQVSTGRQDGADLGPFRYREVKYEDLVARPEEAVGDITSFLELPFAPEMLTYHEGKTRLEPGLSSKKAWLPPTPGLRDWRTHMSERDVALFEAIAGDLLSDLGYKQAINTTPPEIVEMAERCRGWWDLEMARRQGKR